MINIYDRFVAKIFALYFLGAITVLLTLYLSVDAMSSMMSMDAPGLTWAKYYFFMLPSIIYQLLPIVSMIATIFTLSGLNRSNELTAMFSLGMSLARISAPILILVSLVTVFTFFLGDRVVPRANQLKNYTYFVEIKKKPGLYSTVKTNKIWYRSKNILFNIKTLDVKNRKAFGATFYYFDSDWNLVQLISAREVHMVDTTWKLKDGVLTIYEEKSNLPLTKSFMEKTISLDEDVGDLKSGADSSEVLTSRELRGFIEKNKEAGLDTLHYEVDFHAKYGFAFSAFVMAFLGIPFSARHVRSGGVAMSIGACIVLGFVYWSLYSSGQALGRHGAIPAVLAVWIPNISMLGLTGWFLLRLKK
ncbi:MAG: LPS export ABC transporter permease LptG [Bdellovibrionales bacterium]|nr:LPS export ABC transporter permease LptG [Bdellovibrionales bacterium]